MKELKDKLILGKVIEININKQNFILLNRQLEA